jgi:hypothetical protein
MKFGRTGHGAPERICPDQLNAALVRLLMADALAHLSAEHRAVVRRSYYLGWTTAQISDDLHIGECIAKSRLHFALRALRLTLQRQLTRCALHAPGRQRPRADVLPFMQALLAGACDTDRRGAGPHSPGAGGIREG